MTAERYRVEIVDDRPVVRRLSLVARRGGWRTYRDLDSGFQWKTRSAEVFATREAAVRDAFAYVVQGVVSPLWFLDQDDRPAAELADVVEAFADELAAVATRFRPALAVAAEYTPREGG